MRNDGGGEYYLNRLYVAPEFQGKGVGRTAVALCEDFYPDAKRWSLDCPADREANKKCYEYCGYRDAGLREKVSDKLTLARYEKMIGGIYAMWAAYLESAAEVIRKSFATVAAEFGLTEQNCPNHTSFIRAERLRAQYKSGYAMYGLYEDARLVGYVSLSGNRGASFEIHNLAVLPEYRHRGHGTALVDFCKAAARESGAEKIVIGIIRENARLRSWYVARGFASVGSVRDEHLPFAIEFMEYHYL